MTRTSYIWYQWDDVYFVVNLHAKLVFYSASSQKQQSAKINIIVISLTIRPGLKPIIYRAWVKYANHYITDAVHLPYKLLLYTRALINKELYVIIILICHFNYLVISSKIILLSSGITEYFSCIMTTSFSGGRSGSTRREPPTMGKQLVNCITCGWELSAPFFVIYKARSEPTPYWW